MFYTAIFLGGEWAQIDFSWPGKIMCMLLCVMGIALFAIPVGTIFEAFQDVLTEVHTEVSVDRVEVICGPDNEGDGEDTFGMEGPYKIQIGEAVPI